MTSNSYNGTGLDYAKPMSEIGQNRGSAVAALFVNSKPPVSFQIHHGMIDVLADHLDAILRSSKLSSPKLPVFSLILNTQGGNIPAAIGMVSVIREYAQTFEVIVPHEALSAGTVIALGADRIIMTRNARLSQPDPSIVRKFKGYYIPAAAADIETFFSSPIFTEDQKAEALDKLLSKFGPISIGQLLRSQRLVRRTLSEYLDRTIEDSSQRERTLQFLMGTESPHDATFYREQAKATLGLPIEYANEQLEVHCSQLLIAMDRYFKVPPLAEYSASNPAYTDVPVSCFSVLSPQYGRSSLNGVLNVQKNETGVVYRGNASCLLLQHCSFGE